MTNNGAYITGPENVDDHDYLARILKIAIETTENVVALERQQRDGHIPAEEINLSPRDLMSGDPITLAELEQTLSSLSIEDHCQHESCEPGDLCPKCGGEDISVIEPREYIYTYDDEGDVADSTHGDASDPEITERTHVIDAMEAAADGYNSDELLGECTYNARRLYDEIQKRDVTAHIIRGGLDLPDEDGCPASITEAEDLGVVHWWVEALATDEWLTVDLAAEDPDHYGEQLFTPRRPATYIPFEIDPPDSEMFATR